MTVTHSSPAGPEQTVVDGDAQPQTAPETGTPEHGALIEEDLLVEDVSIDGMCGVY